MGRVVFSFPTYTDGPQLRMVQLTISEVYNGAEAICSHRHHALNFDFLGASDMWYDIFL